MLIKPSGETPNDLVIENDGTIRVTMHGHQSVDKIKDTGERVARAIEKQHAVGKKALLLLDIQELRLDATPAERIEGRRQFGAVRADAIALVGATQVVTLGLYLARLARPSLHIRSCKNLHEGRAWLKNVLAPKKQQRSIVGLLTGLVLIAIGLLVVMGWQLSNEYLTSISPSLRPMNPMAAIGLLIIGYGFVSYWRGKVRHLRLVGGLSVILGLAALLPIHINYILYGDRVTALGTHTRVAVSAALCFICMGIVAIIARRDGLWVRLVEYAAAGVMGGLALFNIFGQLYAHDFIYGISDNFVMSLNLAIAFAVATTGLVLLTLYRQMGNVLGNITRMGWLAVFTLIFVQVATYSVWEQNVNRNQTESHQAFIQQAQNLDASVNNVVQAYTNALFGFQGLYAASSFVSQGEFQTYFDLQHLAQNYPGLRSMSFIAAVQTKDLPAFVKQRQQDTSLLPGGNPQFKISSQSNEKMHYIATYTSTTSSNTVLGLDVSSIAGRSAIYGAAIASGQNYTSGTITFPPSNGQPALRGFFITIPVKYEATNNYVGVVNANFAYNSFFPSLFTQKSLTNNLDVSVIDAAGNSVYQAKKATNPIKVSDTFAIPIANGGLQMQVSAPRNFGIGTGQAHVPAAVLVVGQAFALLLVGIFVSQTRARSKAMRLVDDATADLQHERNTVVELNLKDEAILSGIGEGLIAFDQHGRVERINGAAQRIMGWDEHDILGRYFVTAWPAVDMNLHEVAPHKRPISVALEKRKTVVTKLYYTRKNGERFPVEMNVAPVIIDGKVIGAIEVFRDVTHELELDKAKSEFVSLASHQLRTPLSAINWYAEMLLNGDAGKLTKDQTDYLREIFEGNQRMVELVNSLLDVSRLELGRMANEPAPTSVSELINDIEKELTTSILTKKLNLKKDVDAYVPPVVADPKQLRMVVQNLLSNAVKYTPDKGSVEVTLRNATAHDIEAANMHGDHQYVFFSVKDTGYGIPKTQQPHIFEKLFRADNVRKLDVEGTGLGLYIVKQVVETMGGRVWFESIESVGTTFFVVVPVKAATPKRPVEPQP